MILCIPEVPDNVQKCVTIGLEVSTSHSLPSVRMCINSSKSARSLPCLMSAGT